MQVAKFAFQFLQRLDEALIMGKRFTELKEQLSTFIASADPVSGMFIPFISLPKHTNTHSLTLTHTHSLTHSLSFSFSFANGGLCTL